MGAVSQPRRGVVGREPGNLPACLARPDALGFYLRVRDQLRADRPDYTAQTDQFRLFRRDAGVRYRGRLHPAPETPPEELARRQGKRVYAAALVVVRHAYLSALTPDKLRWAAHLLDLELRDRPGQLHYLIDYGRTLLMLNDPRGHAVLADAADQVIAARGAPAAPTPTVGSLLEYLLAVSPEQSQSRLSRAEAQELAARWFPRTPPVVWARAELHFREGRFAEAAPLLEELLRMGRTGEYDHAAAFRPDVMGAPAVMNLGVCYTRLGEPDKAQACFGQLLTSPEYQAQARQNYGMVEALRARGAPPK